MTVQSEKTKQTKVCSKNIRQQQQQILDRRSWEPHTHTIYAQKSRLQDYFQDSRAKKEIPHIMSCQVYIRKTKEQRNKSESRALLGMDLAAAGSIARYLGNIVTRSARDEAEPKSRHVQGKRPGHERLPENKRALRVRGT